MSNKMHMTPTFALLSHTWTWRIFVTLALILSGVSIALAGPREQAARIHDRLAGVPADDATLTQMAAQLPGNPGAAATIAMNNPNFYAVTLKNFAAPWTNRDQSVFVPLNDYVTLVMGLSGAALGLTFQIWTSAYDWPINVGGKPFISLPAFIPITFECGVLIGGTMTLAALLVACGLPNWNKPILDRDLTNDRFGLWVPEIGPEWNEARIIQVLQSTGPTDLRVVRV